MMRRWLSVNALVESRVFCKIVFRGFEMHFASASLWPLILALFSFQLQRSCGCSTKDLFRSNWLHALPPTVRAAVLPPAFGIRQSSRRANRLVPVPVRAAAATTTDGITEQRYINIYFDSTNDCHRDRTYHPESPARIDACVNKLRNEMDNTDGSGIGGSLRLFDIADFPKSADGGTAAHGHRPFSSCELAHAQNMLVLAHSEEYVHNIEDKCKACRQRRVEEGKDPLGFIGYVDNGGDTYLTTESHNVLLRAAAAWIRAVDDVLISGGDPSGDSIAYSLALTRPPGHHATKNNANGFCVFNFAAAAGIHAIQSSGESNRSKVSILDFDVHYGQGVADIMQSYDSCRYASLHQYPAFPYLGSKRGIAGLHDNVLTVPLPPESSWTCGHKLPFEERIRA